MNEENGRQPTIREMFAEVRTDVGWIKRWMEEHKGAHRILNGLVADNQKRIDSIGAKVALWAMVSGAVVGFVATVISKAVGWL